MKEKRESPFSFRPTKRARQMTERLAKEGRLNRTINDFIESLGSDSAPILRMEIDDLTAEKKTALQRLNEIDAEISRKQSRLNTLVHSDFSMIEAQRSIIRAWAEQLDTLHGEMVFRSWITGPANQEMMERAGFHNEDQAVKWCRAQKVSK